MNAGVGAKFYHLKKKEKFLPFAKKKKKKEEESSK